MGCTQLFRLKDKSAYMTAKLFLNSFRTKTGDDLQVFTRQ